MPPNLFSIGRSPLDQNCHRHVEKDEIRFSVSLSLVHVGQESKGFVKQSTKVGKSRGTPIRDRITN
jgi:hypothetical protein